MCRSNNELVSTLCLDKHPNQCHLIVAGCDNGSVCFWDLRQEKQPVLLMSAHSSEGNYISRLNKE